MGAGGGGGVDSQGGILIYSDISIEQYLFDNIYLSVNKGYLMSPNRFFETSTFGIGLKYYSNLNGVTIQDSYIKSKFKGFEAIVKEDIYIDADREINPTENLYQISLQLNYHLNKNLYLAGQTSFANFGNAGAYAEGLVGAGIQSNYFFDEKVNIFTQVLVGGAGGGLISTGEGLIFKPSVGMNYNLNSDFALRGAVGYVKARGGNLSSPLLNFGISYRLSFLSSR